MKYSVVFISIMLYFLLIGCQYRINDGVYSQSRFMSDNAIATRLSIEHALKNSDLSNETLEVTFQPQPKKEYWVIFVPNKWTTQEDMIKEGIDLHVVKTIYKELLYLNPLNRLRGDILYYQDKKISFQSNPTHQEKLVWIRKTGSSFKLTINPKSKKIMKIEYILL